MDPALISSVAALAGVLLGHLLTRSSEYRKWLRAERHEAAAELLAVGEALRRHSAARIVAAYRAGQAADGRETLTDQALDPEIHLADLERLDLALEAVRTVFPPPVAELASEFGDAARALAHTQFTKGQPEQQPGKMKPGDRYRVTREKFTHEARSLIASALHNRLMALVGDWRSRTAS